MAAGYYHLSYNISETMHATKYLTTDIAITSKVLIRISQKRNILPYSFESSEQNERASGKQNKEIDNEN